MLRLTGHEILGSGSGSGGGREWVAFVVLGIALVSEGTSFVRAFGQTREGARESGYSLVEFVRISKEPTTKMVFSEDAVAVAGIAVAFAGLALQVVTGSEKWDAGAAGSTRGVEARPARAG